MLFLRLHQTKRAYEWKTVMAQASLVFGPDRFSQAPSRNRAIAAVPRAKLQTLWWSERSGSDDCRSDEQKVVFQTSYSARWVRQQQLRKRAAFHGNGWRSALRKTRQAMADFTAHEFCRPEMCSTRKCFRRTEKCICRLHKRQSVPTVIFYAPILF